MSDSQEKSDDLIAELAKLMATNAQGSESEPKSTVIKLAPLGESSMPPPVRIPGMAAPPPAGAAVKPVTPVVRIPGMEKPAGVDTPGPTVNFLGATAPRPPAASAIAAAESVPAPQTAERPGAPQGEPGIVPPPGGAPTAATPQPDAVAQEDGFKFDFGFGTGGSVSVSEGNSGAPQEQPQPAPTSSLPHDPIADLIAAELDASQAVPAKPLPGAGIFPSSVEVVPARTFGHTTAGQAPVLVARPVSTTPRPAPAAFRPPQPAPKRAESDKFAVAPVFGLGGRQGPAPAASPPLPPGDTVPTAPAEPAPRALDPMDEIESLIGEAVRVELSGDEETTRSPQVQHETQPPVAPVVPPLTTGFAPRRAGLKDNEPQVRSAEAAILAAAAATGAEVGRIGPATGDDPYRRSRGKASGTANAFGGLRQYVGLAVAGTLLLAAGFGLYWVLGMGRGNTEAPVLAADPTPAKEAPAPSAAGAEEPARSVVFNEINGVAAADDAETLVSRDETAGADVTEVARVVAEPPAATESGLANRKVRTVTVRPDGTIVSGDEAVAGTEALPVERPNVPAVPGVSVEPSDLLTAAVGEADPLATAVEPDPIAAVIAEGQAAADATPVEVAALAPTDSTPPVFDASLVAPVPMPRPVDRNALRSVAPAPAESATASPAASLDDLPLVDLDEPATAPSAAAAYVQISSQPTEADAQAAIRSAQSRWGSLFNGNQLIVQRADLGAKGIKYRVRLPASSLQEATQICASIKADGGDCFATNG